ncbi:MAG: hypothetical protein IKS18_00250 [Lachnospiraceae bacterium]|nr:hypothetical protein [Lachnospiraceae bacterium]
MSNFWDTSVWGFVCMSGSILLSLLLANGLKRLIKVLQKSLIPTSVVAGLILLLISSVYRRITGTALFDTEFFGGNGVNMLEIITYHALALGFIASTFRSDNAVLSKERRRDILNTGTTTVASYLIQAIAGLLISIIAAKLMKDFFVAAGLLLPFGYGQGTGQALNYGSIYEADYGFTGGRSFGLTIAACGFLSASIGGVIYLNVLKKRGIYSWSDEKGALLRESDIQSEDEIPMNGAIDKLTVQIALVLCAYFLAYIIMMVLGKLIPSFRSVVYGFNFLFGVLGAILIKQIMKLLKKTKLRKREYCNSFLMTRISNFWFDIMVVAGVAAIRIEVLRGYWWIILILALTGLLITFFYNRFIAKKLFPKYENEQFLAMYGMLTGTASTGVMLLREVDPDFKTPTADNLVYQNFPAMILGFPIMLLATLAPKKPWLVLLIACGLFLVMNLILFRSYIFKRKEKN